MTSILTQHNSTSRYSAGGGSVAEHAARTYCCHVSVTADLRLLAKAMVDDWEFSEAQFTEFVGTTFTLLAAFMGVSSEYDSQLQVGALSTPGICASHHSDPAIAIFVTYTWFVR